jgi:hypothetical protein
MFYNLQDPYSLATWYECNGMYDLNVGTDLQLDLIRHILESDNYLFRGVSFPRANDIYIPSQQSFSGTVNLMPYSYIMGLTGWSGNQNAFTLRIYDRGAQTDLFFRQFAWYPTVVSNMQAGPNMGVTINQGVQDKPFTPHLFRSPLIVLPPGILQVQLSNVARPEFDAGGIAQLLFLVAVPKSSISMANRKMTSSTDQTGVPSMQTLVGLIGG